MGEKRNYNTTLDSDLVKKLRILAAETGKRQNELIEEAIKDILTKYEKQGEETPRAQEA